MTEAGQEVQVKLLEQYEELKPGFDNTLELIVGISSQLKDIAEILENTQADISNAIRR